MRNICAQNTSCCTLSKVNTKGYTLHLWNIVKKRRNFVNWKATKLYILLPISYKLPNIDLVWIYRILILNTICSLCKVFKNNQKNWNKIYGAIDKLVIAVMTYKFQSVVGIKLNDLGRWWKKTHKPG